MGRGYREAAGLTQAPTATADKPYAGIWCPTGVQRISLMEFGFGNTAVTGGKIALKRTSARGTVTTSVTFADQDEQDLDTTATLDIAYSADPTVAGIYMRRFHYAAAIGAGMIWSWWASGGLTIPANAGVALVVPTAAAGQALECWAVIEQ